MNTPTPVPEDDFAALDKFEAKEKADLDQICAKITGLITAELEARPDASNSFKAALDMVRRVAERQPDSFVTRVDRVAEMELIKRTSAVEDTARTLTSSDGSGYVNPASKPELEDTLKTLEDVLAEQEALSNPRGDVTASLQRYISGVQDRIGAMLAS